MSGLPRGVYVHCVKEDPKRRGLLVAGTERGVYFSIDDGDSWHAAPTESAGHVDA